MTKQQLYRFIKFLGKKGYRVFSPQKSEGEVLISKIEKPENIYFGPQLPFYSFKYFFLPVAERLLEFNNGRPSLPKTEYLPTAIFGINPKDLRAAALYDLVFEKDPYYQERRKKIFIVGLENAENPAAARKEELVKSILPHLKFDIFLFPEKNSFSVFTGSKAAEKILKGFKYKEFIPIKFQGFLNEEEQKSVQKFSGALKMGWDSAVWQELGKICIECGKCSTVCPTCFCFRIDDGFGQKAGESFRARCLDSCFFSEFSEVAGGHRFLDTTQKKIHFWYYHKFARIPDEYKVLGCVGCHRCSRVCPVGIDIKKVLKQLELFVDVKKSL